MEISYINNTKILITKETYEKNQYTWNYDNDIWEKNVITFFSEQLYNSHSCVIDIGAQSGCFSLLSKIHKDTYWHCFEPDIINYGLLKDNLSINDIKNCKIYNIGLGNIEGKTTLHRSDHFGLHTIGNNLKRFDNKDINNIEIKISTLDNMFPTENINFIKIDTEGAELRILKGGINLIKRCKPNILLEFNDTNLQQCGNSSIELLKFIMDVLDYKIIKIFFDDIYICPNN